MLEQSKKMIRILSKWSDTSDTYFSVEDVSFNTVHLQTTSGKSKWSVMDNHGPILNPIPCQPPFRQSPPGAIASPQSSLRCGFDWLHGPSNWWCCKLIKSTAFCWQKNWSSFCSENLNSRELMQIRSSLHSLLKICQGKMGQITFPILFISRSALPPFVDSASCQPLKHLAVNQNLTGIQKKHTKLIYKKK